jgi:DNA polymerase IV (DinB-like DNA polymerase)
VEIRDNPQYRGKPVIIGADPKEGKGRGVVSTCSYEARKLGLHSGMPISQAFQRCPHGIYLRPSIKKYTEASKSVMNILGNYSENFQQMGNDEAYIELTDKCTSYEEANQTAKLIQKEISENLGITISIGIAPTKSLAKIASDCNKPNGITLFKPNTYKEMLKNMDITRIPGIGKKSKIYFYKKGIKKIEDILKTPLDRMIKLFGEHGKWIWNVVNGFDNRKVKEFQGDRKSISAERTFYSDTDDFKDILSKLEDINKRIHKSIKKDNINYKTITLKIRFEGYQTYTRSKTLPYPIQDERLVIIVVLELLQQFSKNKKKVRLVGIKLSNLEKSKKARQTNILNFVQT